MVPDAQKLKAVPRASHVWSSSHIFVVGSGPAACSVPPSERAGASGHADAAAHTSPRQRHLTREGWLHDSIRTPHPSLLPACSIPYSDLSLAIIITYSTLKSVVYISVSFLRHEFHESRGCIFHPNKPP